MITPEAAATYLETYIRHYRAEYGRLTSLAPQGGGYPHLPVSPYLEDGVLECLLARDGAVIADTSREPEYNWHVAGGPAIVTDFPVSRIDPQTLEIVEAYDQLLDRSRAAFNRLAAL